jgi:poly(ADP-ribose) glycohydrolase ARH3
MTVTVADALAGSLLGQALGDALGFVVEAQPPAVAAEYVTGCLLAGRAGERAHPVYPFGQYSDDTQLARELLRSVRAAGRWDPEGFACYLAELFHSQRDVGAGAGTRAAAGRLLTGIPWHESGTPAPYAGNGSAMRAGPLGLLFDSPERMCQAACDQSRVTHGDPRCASGAVVVAGAVFLAAQPGPLDRVGFLKQLAAWACCGDRSVADAVGDLESWCHLDPVGAARHLHEAGLDPAYTDAWRGISACVIPSVLWSLYSFLRSPDDYWATITTAIAVGGDTDTMAAIAGAVSGARLGPSALPTPLLDRLTDRGEWGAQSLSELAYDCARLIPLE